MLTHIIVIYYVSCYYTIVYVYYRHNSGNTLAQSGGMDSPTNSTTVGGADKDSSANKVVDIVADRRRAKALKVYTTVLPLYTVYCIVLVMFIRIFIFVIII